MTKQTVKFKPLINVTLKNRVNNETFTCDIINEDSIDGKLYFVVKHNNRILKYSKESYTMVRK